MSFVGGNVTVHEKIARDSVIDFEGSGTVLTSLISDPNLVSKFLASEFQQHPAVFRGSKARLELLKALLFDFSIKELLQNSASEQTQVWMKSVEVNKPLSSIKVEDPSAGITQYLLMFSFNNLVLSFLSLFCLQLTRCTMRVILYIVDLQKR